MTLQHKINRRGFLQMASAGVALPLLAACNPPNRAIADTHVNAVAASASDPKDIITTSTNFQSDIELLLRASPGSTTIRPGNPTNVWTITGEVIQGDPGVLEAIPDCYLGPTIRMRKGQRVRVHFANELAEASILHWHGLHVPAEMDGHPRFAIGPGNTFVYDFEVRNRAGTYWYHPHPHGRTGPQVYAGMAGLFLVADDEEDAAGLPNGEYDIPLVIQDRTLNRNNQLVYQGNGMMDQMMGFLGEEIWVNGKPDFVLPVATRAYRLRLLNGSNSRIYKLGWDDGTPLTVIGTDGGLLENAVQRPYVMLAPGERVELWADFSGRPVGNELELRSLPFTVPAEMGGMMGGMGNRRGGMMGSAQSNPSMAQGAAFSILTIRIAQDVQETVTLPARLSTLYQLSPTEAVNGNTPRTIAMQMRMPGGWTLNGRTFDMTGVANDEIVRLGSTEVWEFVNRGGGMGMMGGMMLPHPMHVHGESFQVIERQVDPNMRSMWETVSAGYVDEGWKDTVLVMPGERVKILRRFNDYTGLYLYHCHNLEHEDMGMMRNFRVDPA